mmetsp:Transcript_8541/g.20520  ORF Transcript_8541/g.20520 Transcript_8541/m.20520 type:complete len:244 (+) Transcript_8541:305-1036(+)
MNAPSPPLGSSLGSAGGMTNGGRSSCGEAPGRLPGSSERGLGEPDPADGGRLPRCAACVARSSPKESDRTGAGLRPEGTLGGAATEVLPAPPPCGLEEAEAGRPARAGPCAGRGVSKAFCQLVSGPVGSAAPSVPSPRRGVCESVSTAPCRSSSTLGAPSSASLLPLWLPAEALEARHLSPISPDRSWEAMALQPPTAGAAAAAGAGPGAGLPAASRTALGGGIPRRWHWRRNSADASSIAIW